MRGKREQNPRRLALGFRAHSGWAAMVVIAGTPFEPELIDRRRVELTDSAVPGSKQPYHSASEMERKYAAGFIKGCIRETDKRARRAVSAAAADFKNMGYEVCACGVLLGSARPLPALDQILASHLLLHTAEGQMYRDALVRASVRCSLPVATASERDVLAVTGARLGLEAEALEQLLARVGKDAGAPWRQDQKLAMLAGMLALAL
ncbi:MAG: hypothetical protein ACREDR_01440 [Blastocatellia bacterium]